MKMLQQLARRRQRQRRKTKVDPAVDNNDENVITPVEIEESDEIICNENMSPACEIEEPVETSIDTTEPAVDPEDYLVLKEVESGDVPEPQKSFLDELFFRMNPLQCLSTNLPDAIDTCGVIAYKSCVAGPTEEFQWVLPDILNDVENGSAKTRTAALQRFYRLVDRDHKDNRSAAVCSTQLETVKALTSCLNMETPAADRRQALLILNNLCIPNDNKAMILFGDTATPLLTALLSLVRARTPECYLALVTLVNLSFLLDDQAKSMLLNFVPEVPNQAPPSTYRFELPANNPLSLLRTLEDVLKDYVPYLQTHQSVKSVEQQCCRWAMNALRNLSTFQDNAVVMACKSRVPEHATACLRCANFTNLKDWTRDSLEDAALMLLVHLGKDDDCLVNMRENTKLRQDIATVCDELERKGKGIHRTRAAALKERFEENLVEKSTMGYSA